MGQGHLALLGHLLKRTAAVLNHTRLMNLLLHLGTDRSRQQLGSLTNMQFSVRDFVTNPRPAPLQDRNQSTVLAARLAESLGVALRQRLCSLEQVTLKPIRKNPLLFIRKTRIHIAMLLRFEQYTCEFLHTLGLNHLLRVRSIVEINEEFADLFYRHTSAHTLAAPRN